MYDEFDDIQENNLLLVDSLNYAFRFKHKGSKVFASNFVRDMASFANSYKANNVIILGDGGSTYRKGIYPEYKANRVYADEDKQDFEEFLLEYNKALELCNYPIFDAEKSYFDEISDY